MILGDATFRYYPIWDVSKNDVFVYLCEAFWDLGEDHLLSEEEIADEFSTPDKTKMLDLETVNTAISQLDEIFSNYGIMNVLVPIHFMTLLDENSFGEYADEVGGKIWPFKSNVYFEIVKPPEIMSLEDCRSAVENIETFGNGVFIRLNMEFETFKTDPEVAILGVGMDVRSSSNSDQLCMDGIRKLLPIGETCGVKTYIHGLNSSISTLTSIKAGIDFVGSDTLSPPLEKFDDVAHSMTPADILSDLLKSK